MRRVISRSCISSQPGGHIAAACSGQKVALFRAGAAGLRHLNVSSNLFSGAVPASWANLRRLENVTLENNALSGTVPAFLLAMPALTALSAYNNTMTGTLPPSPGALPAC